MGNVRNDLLSDLTRFLEFGYDPLRNGSVFLSVLVFLGGLILLGVRIRAAWKGLEASRSLVAHRMTAALGALGGVVAYLRGLPRPEARLGLVLGGISAVPWAAVILLELVRRRRGGGRRSDRGARE